MRFTLTIPGLYFLNDNLPVPTNFQVFSHKSLKSLARPKGFEPLTSAFGEPLSTAVPENSGALNREGEEKKQKLVRLCGRLADGAMTVNVAGAWSKD
jgi:hypothetical protein